MRVSVFIKMRHAMYASSSVEEVRVIETGSVEALDLDFDDDWRELPEIEVEDKWPRLCNVAVHTPFREGGKGWAIEPST